MREFYQWRDSVVKQVRFRPDRTAVAEELTAHYEDHVKDLERLGYDRSLAESRALDAMGDAEEIGRALDKAHKPWLGWLWLVSKALAVLSLIVVLLYGGPGQPVFHPCGRDKGGQYGSVRIHLFHSLRGTVEGYAGQ